MIELRRQILPLLLTAFFLIILEVLATVFFPALGLETYRIPFNIIVILYLGFKIETPIIALFIVVIQYTHSLFSIEGWEMGTITGILVCMTIGYLKELLHFSSSILTILVTQLFMILWLVINSGIAYLKFNNLDYIIDKAYRFIPESVIISLLSPILFIVFDKIWGVSSKDGMLGEEV